MLYISYNLSQMKLVPYAFPNTRIKLKRDLKDTSVSGKANTEYTQAYHTVIMHTIIFFHSFSN